MALSLSDEAEKKRLKRFNVISELYDTEKGYVSDLNNLVRNVLDPLNSAYLASVANSVASKGDPASASKIVENITFGNEGGSWITFDQKQAIVRNASHLLRVQKLFFKLLEDAVRVNCTDGYKEKPLLSPETSATNSVAQDASVLQIAKCFQTMMQKLESVYLPYCSMHDVAIETLNLIRKNFPNQLNNFLDDCRSKMNSKLEVQDFLIKPVQRICKYPLLLKELAKATPQDSPDYKELMEALEKIKDLVSQINEKKRFAENERKKELLLSRLHAGQTDGIHRLASVFDISLDGEVKQIPSTQAGTDLSYKIGKLLRVGCLHVMEHEPHELPFAAPLSNNAEVTYHGLVLFPTVLLVLWAKKSILYPIMHVIPLQDIVNYQELHEDSLTVPDSIKAKLKYAWRMTWEVGGILTLTSSDTGGRNCRRESNSGQVKSLTHFWTLDFGAKDKKELADWLKTFERLLPEGKSSLYMNSSSYTVLGPLTSDSQEVGASAKKPTTTRKGSIVSHSDIASPIQLASARSPIDDEATAQAIVDMKFADVIATDIITADIPRIVSTTNHIPRTIISNPNANLSTNTGTINRLFRKGSQRSTSATPEITSFTGNSGTVDASRVSPASGTTRRNSQKKKLRPMSMFGFGSVGEGDSGASKSIFGGLSSSDLSSAQLNDQKSTDKRTSFQDLTTSAKKAVSGRGRSNSVTAGPKKASPRTSISTLDDDNASTKNEKISWSNGLKAKILSVTKLSSTKRSQAGLDGQTSRQASNETIDAGSADVDAESGDGKKTKMSILGSLARTFSKRTANVRKDVPSSNSNASLNQKPDNQKVRDSKDISHQDLKQALKVAVINRADEPKGRDKPKETLVVDTSKLTLNTTAPIYGDGPLSPSEEDIMTPISPTPPYITPQPPKSSGNLVRRSGIRVRTTSSASTSSQGTGSKASESVDQESADRIGVKDSLAAYFRAGIDTEGPAYIAAEQRAPSSTITAAAPPSQPAAPRSLPPSRGSAQIRMKRASRPQSTSDGSSTAAEPQMGLMETTS